MPNELLRLHRKGSEVERQIFEMKAKEAAHVLDLDRDQIFSMVGASLDMVHGALQLGLTVEKIIDPQILSRINCNGEVVSEEDINVRIQGHQPPFLVNVLDGAGNPTSFCPMHPYNKLSKVTENE